MKKKDSNRENKMKFLYKVPVVTFIFSALILKKTLNKKNISFLFS